MGTEYIGALVSLALQDKGSRSCIKGGHGDLNSCAFWAAGLTAE
jgi:hypothetical protein